MQTLDIVNECRIRRSARVAALLGMFEIGRSETSTHRVTGELDIDGDDWGIGLIVGPSGCGKSTVARNLFKRHLVGDFKWPRDASIVDAFPKGLSIKTITGTLSAVGFSSPPAWLRPYRVLSTGEQFRVRVARAMVEAGKLFVLDEFTSVVDRTVAKIGSAAIAKAVRRAGKRFVAVSCHYDIVDWLAPDWVFEPHTGRFQKKKKARRDEGAETRRGRKAAGRLLNLSSAACIETLGHCSANITI